MYIAINIPTPIITITHIGIGKFFYFHFACPFLSPSFYFASMSKFIIPAIEVEVTTSSVTSGRISFPFSAPVTSICR